MALVVLATAAGCQKKTPAADVNSDADNAQISADGSTSQPKADADTDAQTNPACWQPLDVGEASVRCPARFNDTTWKADACPNFSVRPTVLEQVCAGYLSRGIEYGTHSTTCFYDPATQVLIAAKLVDDVPTYCDHTSSSIVAGTIPASGACTSPATQVDPGCATADGGTPEPNADAADAHAPQGDAQTTADAACREPLDAKLPFDGCPARFDTSDWKAQACAFLSPPATVTEHVCAGYLSRLTSWGTHASNCYYDPTTQVLIAAKFFDDETSYCDRTSFSIEAGIIPAPGTCAGPEVKVDVQCTTDASASQ